MFNDDMVTLRRQIIAYTDDPFSLSERDLLQYIQTFQGWIDRAHIAVKFAEKYPTDEYAQRDKASEEMMLPETEAALDRLAKYVAERDNLSAASPNDYKPGTKLRVNRTFDISEYDLKEGMTGTRAKVDPYTMSRVPEGKIPVRFKATKFGFVYDPEFTSVVLFLPNFAVDAV